MLTNITIENGKIYASVHDVDAMGGDVLPGIATREQIIAYANENWSAPFEAEDGSCYGDYEDFEVEFLKS